MNLSRRNFLKVSGLSFIGVFFGSIALSGCKAVNKLTGTRKRHSICPFCSVGCGVAVSVKHGKIINIDGDQEHPINRGKLCAKGSILFQLSVNDKRLMGVKYRASGTTEWQELSWEEAIKKIATNIKNTRDKTFIEYDDKNTVNSTAGLAVLAGSDLNNEEYYLLSKLARLLGITNLGNDSELSSTASGVALSSTLGYGAMTNHWIDIKNSDVVLIIGSNPAENQPVSIKHILKAKENNAKIIHVDPRYTRTSSVADYYASLRPGTDIAFIGGIINYALQNSRIHKEYILEYTNASYLINSNYKFKNGIYNDFKDRKYNNSTWDYERDRKGIPRMDKTLRNENTVFQILKNHFSRYNAELVSRVTGCPVETFLTIADVFTSTYERDRAGTILYSSGATQHTIGTQNVRIYTILQLLLGNIGVAGGGLNAITPGSNDQGAADHGLTVNYLPGYLSAPVIERHNSLDSYIKDTQYANDPMGSNMLSRRRIQIVNLLKSFFGETASKENDYCFHWLPKIKQPVIQKSIFNDIQNGIIKGAFFTGTNPLLNVPDTNGKIRLLENLEWMAVSDIFETETSSFWKRPGADPLKIKTEVFLLPAASVLEKEGSLTNSGRWVQWRDKIINPPGQAKSDLWIIDNIYKELSNLYKEDNNAAFPDSIVRANWGYAVIRDEILPTMVAREINGQILNTKKMAGDITELEEDGTTAAGNWLYCGSFTEKGNMMERRINKDTSGKIGLYHRWAWSWPSNSRILYNRASVNRNGTPWDNDKWVMKWDEEWDGDIVNGEYKSGPAEKNPFIMLYEGVARIFAKDLAEGPLPEHYEPVESPAVNLLNQAGASPLIVIPGNRSIGSATAFPYIATMYKIAEQWKPGIMTKNLPWLTELAPKIFCEISESLAETKKIRNGDKVVIKSQRGKLSAYCLVSSRIHPFLINGKKLEMIGIIMNSCEENFTNNSNLLSHDFRDANTGIAEYKAFLVNVSLES